jgi:hypothetical protein
MKLLFENWRKYLIEESATYDTVVDGLVLGTLTIIHGHLLID